MTRRNALYLLTAACLLALAPVALAADAAGTWTFAAGEKATQPKTITLDGSKIVVDLSAVPKDAKVFRAVLHVERQGGPGWGSEDAAAQFVAADAPEKPLPLLPPRYAAIDATVPVAAAVKAGAGKVEIVVKAFPGWKKGTERLDVSLAGPPGKGAIPAPTKLAARHRNGQTLLTWTEPAPATKAEEMTFGEYNALRKTLAAAETHTTFRIYRSAKPISAATIAEAELVDEIGPLSCWNPNYSGVYPGEKEKLPRYVVEDGGKPVAPDTGIYAHNPAQAGKAYYAVAAALDGAEDFAKLAALAEAVDEKVGAGDPVLQKIEKPEDFMYAKGNTLHFYTRWEAPPRNNLPSDPHDYVVVLGPKLAEPAPLNLILHCWGSNFLGRGGAYSIYGWGDRDRGIGVASNQRPYDWWTTYHENSGTWKPWTEGVSRNFTSTRLLAFVDFVKTKWKVDENRICVSGESMGGSGSTFMPIRYPKLFAYAFSAVGIHDPAQAGAGFHESYARSNGQMKLDIKHESGLDAWDYLSDPKLVLADPKQDLPFIGYGNGKNDGGIGWPHVVALAKALQEARQPHAMVWNMRGHGAGSFRTGLDHQLNQSLPAFTNCSLDNDIGTAKRLETPKEVTVKDGAKDVTIKDAYDGDPEGQINVFLRWKTDTIVDEAGKWEITCYLAGGRGAAAKEECTVDVTPRRLQKLKIAAGDKFGWTVAGADGKETQSGQATADKFGLVTMEKVKVTTGDGLRIVLKK